MKIGRYEIRFGRACWVQTQVPTTIRCFLPFVWILKKARPQDTDKSPQFPLGTRLETGGKVYRYYRYKEIEE